MSNEKQNKDILARAKAAREEAVPVMNEMETYLLEWLSTSCPTSCVKHVACVIKWIQEKSFTNWFGDVRDDFGMFMHILPRTLHICDFYKKVDAACNFKTTTKILTLE